MVFGLIAVILVALVVFWLVSHFSLLLAVVAALLVLLAGYSGFGHYGRRDGL